MIMETKKSFFKKLMSNVAFCIRLAIFMPLWALAVLAIIFTGKEDLDDPYLW